MNETITTALFNFPADIGAAGRRDVSVIIPAHNAVATLEATLNSVVHQTHALWELVLVDDGSTDGTRAMAEHWARKDKRFRVLHQERSGVSAARNRGLWEARCPLVLFLDADDRIAPTHLERMVGKLAADATLHAVHCGSQHVLPSGATGRPRLGSDEADLFRYLAFQCVFDIHACVLRRDLAMAVGGFDLALTTCEDWDFFQRVARTGARFGRVPEILAFYHIRPGSASQNSRRCVTDARVVVNRGHGPDPRIRIAAEVHAEGETPTYRDLAFYYTLTAFAAQDIGAGSDGLDLIDADLPPAPDLSAAAIAGTIEELLPIAANRSEGDWLVLWRRVSAPLAAFLTKLEARARAPAVAFATLRHLEKKILLADAGDTPLLLGSAYRVNVELTRKIRDVFLPPEADRVICRLTLKGEPIGALELPGAGVVTGWRIADAALEGRGRLVLGRALTPGRGLRLGLRTVRGLLRSRTSGLLYRLMAAKPMERSAAVLRLKHEVADMVKANLSQILATRPGIAAQQADRRWREHLEATAAAGRAQVRGQLGTERARIATVAREPARSPNRPPAKLVAQRTCSVPILMYHRIATDGPIALERYRLSPDLFALQMTALHRAGYHTISLRDWASAIVRLEPLPGKPAIITFDDGYRDFLSAAVPVLYAHDFSATVFLVAEQIGGSADWDTAYGETAPLLSWEEVRALQETGIEFGCHSSVHRPMTGMHLKELAEDTVRARAILEEGLAAPVTTLAYPHGAVNDFVRGVIADLDFRAAVSCESGISQFGDDVLRLRRIEIPGGCTAGHLLALIDHTSNNG